VGLTPLAVSVLALLAERPMHPYEMYSLMLERHQDYVVKVKPGSLYHTVARLNRDGLVEVAGVDRAGARPERTTYAITPAGADAMRDWIRRTLGDPAREHQHFPVALAEAHNLPRGIVIDLLRQYLKLLTDELDIAEAATRRAAATGVPEAYWLTADYFRALRRCERDWIARTIDRLETKDLTWPNEQPAEQPTDRPADQPTERPR
jgi:DNA-binding PadR family transcriptional regulator